MKEKLQEENNLIMKNVKQVITDYVAEEIDNLNEDDSRERQGNFQPLMRHKVPFDKLHLDIQYQLDNLDLFSLQNERDTQDKHDLEQA